MNINHKLFKISSRTAMSVMVCLVLLLLAFGLSDTTELPCGTLTDNSCICPVLTNIPSCFQLVKVQGECSESYNYVQCSKVSDILRAIYAVKYKDKSCVVVTIQSCALPNRIADWGGIPELNTTKGLQIEEFQILNSNLSEDQLSQGLLRNLSTLTTASIRHGNLDVLPENTFQGDWNLTRLSLDHNNMKSLSGDTFLELQHLAFLDLSYNSLNVLPRNVFKDLINLKNLSLHHNKLSNLNDQLNSLKRLEYLDLSFNNFEYVTPDVFLKLHSLKTLNISDNRLKTLFDPENLLLEERSNLQDLQLANNSFELVDWTFILHLDNLSSLNLSHNNITRVEMDKLVTNNNPGLSIDLSDNQIVYVSFNASLFTSKAVINITNESTDSYLNVTLTKNSFSCTCHLLSYLHLLREYGPGLKLLQKTFSQLRVVNVNLGPDFNCTNYMVKDITLSTDRYIESYSISCTGRANAVLSYKCPEGCSCSYEKSGEANIIDCRQSGLHKTPDVLPVFKYANHTRLHLEGNLLENVDFRRKKGYHKVTHLYLSHNRLRTFILGPLLLNRIEVLDVSYNNLSILSQRAIIVLKRSTKLRELRLDGNPWECGCSALNLSRMAKDLHTKVYGLDNATCENGTLIMDLDQNALCPESTLPTSSIAPIIVTISVIFAIAGFSFVILTVLYYNYRKEIYIYCFSSRWAILRWLVSRPDLDVDKVYDAFISYSVKDEGFVVNHLVPCLEAGKFKLCLHFRDWIGGEPIVNQILESVKNSRRTIVILSSNYLKSKFCIMEFRTAYEEALRNGEARVIVVMYELAIPICDLNEDLRKYLELNTYLNWGSQWFWQQLFYAMPHPLEERRRNANDILCCCSRDESGVR